MKLTCNIGLENGLEGKGQVWSAKNGATRRTLVVINKTGKEIEANVPFPCRLGTLDKGNHSFIFINAGENQQDERELGLFLNYEYGFDTSIEPIFKASSVGGYGNSKSKFAIVEKGTEITVHTYKNRHTPDYYNFTGTEFKELEPYEAEGSEIEEI